MQARDPHPPRQVGTSSPLGRRLRFLDFLPSPLGLSMSHIPCWDTGLLCKGASPRSGRRRLAHGESRGKEVPSIDSKRAPSGATSGPISTGTQRELSDVTPSGAGGLFFPPFYPWLPPWATRCRPLRGLPVAVGINVGTPGVPAEDEDTDKNQPLGRVAVSQSRKSRVRGHSLSVRGPAALRVRDSAT